MRYLFDIRFPVANSSDISVLDLIVSNGQCITHTNACVLLRAVLQEQHDRLLLTYGHENHGTLRAYAYLVDMYVSFLNPFLEMKASVRKYIAEKMHVNIENLNWMKTGRATRDISLDNSNNKGC